MRGLSWFVVWAALMALVFASGIAVRRRLSRRLRAEPPTVDDEALRQIIETGSLATSEDEPLDLEQIDQEERRFWSDSWDEPEEW